MKRLWSVVLVCLVCVFLAGCFQFHKSMTLRIKGKGIKTPFGAISPVDGEEVQATIIREFHFTAGSQKNDQPFSNVVVQEESEEKGEVEIKK